jgi:hypothetical protein
VQVDTDPEKAIAWAHSCTDDAEAEMFFAAGSARNDLVGTGVAHRSVTFHRTIGTPADLNVYFADVVAIYQVVTHLTTHVARWLESMQKRIRIFCTNQSALLALGVFPAACTSLQYARAQRVRPLQLQHVISPQQWLQLIQDLLFQNPMVLSL